MKHLLALVIALFVLAFAAWARSEPTEPCARADYLAGEIQDGLDLIEELIAMAKPVCADRALARECARQRIEIQARIAEVLQLKEQWRKAAERCRAGTATRKASSE